MKRTNATLTINLDVISDNVDVLKSHLAPGVQFMAVVKADAYGHGAVEVARKITPQVDWLAVNEVREGLTLREAGITLPILVFEVPEKQVAAQLKKYNLTATISAVQHFERLPQGTHYHLNFNTGMGRLGFRPEQRKRVAKLKKDHPALVCTGIYSHFATADELDSKKMYQQFSLFKEIRKSFEDDLLTCINNTAGILQRNETQLDMARAGIGIYGYAPGETDLAALKPAMHWQTHLVQVNKIAKGETVSYGAVWQAPQDGFVGIIPVGYMDGIPRGLTGELSVTIDDRDFPVVGTITMNYCMIYLGRQRFEEGQIVQLWNKKHTPKEWADKIRTIPYEILTGVAASVSRKYTTSDERKL